MTRLGEDDTRAREGARRADGTFGTRTRAEPTLTELDPGDPLLGQPPLVEFNEVFHVGTMSHAARNKESLEGTGLSVSRHPEEWSRIARLGGGQIFTLSRADGNPLRFVSWHELDDSTRDLVRDWACAHDWIEQRVAWRVTYWDDELDEDVFMELETETGARAEADEYETDAEEVMVWRATSTFPDDRAARDIDPTDLVLAEYLRSHRPDIDGVWWDDRLDPHAYSAPRGVLVHPLDEYSIGT
jgi:hypothetical protein